MRFWAIVVLFLIWVASPVFSGPAVVTAGEHSGFTRIVLQFGAPVDWQLGRGPQGYILRVRPNAPVYDLKSVFNLIGKTRLTAASVDPATGDLSLNLSCRCYAMPFEERPGVVVVDLRDGAAPPGSSFELPLEFLTAGNPKTGDPKPSYDWTTLPLSAVGTGMPLVTNLATPSPSADQTLEALRLSLIQDLSRGASQGVVDMVVPAKPAEPRADPTPLPAQIQIGPDPNLVTRQKASVAVPLTAQGAECWSDDKLDITSWGGQQPVAAQMGPQRQGLTGEFDTPDPAAVTRAIRFALFLGFGAEARSLTRAFAPNAPDAAIWHSMAHALDGEIDPSPAFAGMEHCDTAAGLWATLADPKAIPTSPQAKAAILRSFSAMPPHLRRLLGPDLVGRVLKASDLTLATALYDAVMRAAGDQSPALVMMQAQMDRALGKPDTAIARVSDLAKAPGPGAAEALVDLVETQVPLGQPITFAQVQALEAHLTERRGGPDAPRFQRALILAKAASGDFDGAFSLQDSFPDVAPTLWQVLAQSSPNSAFLTYASLGSSDPVPQAAKRFAMQITERMLALGLSDQAGLWVAHAPQAPPEVLARVKLAQGDAQAALDLLKSDTSATPMQLKAQAYQVLGQPKQAADIYAHLGQSADHWHAIRQAGDWQSIASQGPAPWKEIAALATALAPDAATGPLAYDKALVAHSVATRDAILVLLDQTKAPVPATQ